MQEDNYQMSARNLSLEDTVYFESEKGFIQVFNFFITAITKGKAGMIKASDFEYYLDWSTPEFIEVLSEE